MIEVIVVLIVAALIMWLASAAVVALLRGIDVKQTRNNVALLTDAANAFYEAYCQVIPVSSRPEPSVTRLVSDGFLPNANNARNYWGEEFVVEVIWGRHDAALDQQGTTLRVSATMSGRYPADRIISNLNPTRVTSSHRAEWDSKPTIFHRRGGEDVINYLRVHFERDSDVCR